MQGDAAAHSTEEFFLHDDFYDASGDWPSMDVAYMCDDTHFNIFDNSMYEKTIRQYERFYSGYSKVRTINTDEFSAIFDFIAVRHYQIVSRIIRCQGPQSMSKETFEEQHDWLMKWRDQCDC